MTRNQHTTLANTIRRIVLERSHEAGVGHIGSSLSVADIIAALYGGVLQGQPADQDRDRFVMSKGHAALALFAALTQTGRLSDTSFENFCGPGGLLGVHPDPGIPGIDFGTGSLGQGLSVGAGAALAGRLAGHRGRTFVLLSDAELNEGAVWEAAQFAGHHQLGGLVAVVDVNGQQAFGYTQDVVAIPNLRGAWESFGWDVDCVDGHDTDALVTALDVATESAPPRVVLANTVFGRGVSFMEQQIPWHYLPLDDALYEQAMQELGRP